MSDHFYPELDLQTLRHINTVRKLYELHPTYFLESPYPGEVQKFFDSLKGNPMPESKGFQEAAQMLNMESDNKWDNLAKEAVLIYNDLKGVKVSTESPNEKIQYFKTISNLLEKLVSLQERAMGLKNVHEFHKAVMEVMEEVLTPTQRTDVMQKLQDVINNPSEE